MDYAAATVERVKMDPQTDVLNQEQQMAAWIAGEYDYSRPRRGEIREAIILDIGENDIIVDLGAKRDAIVPPRDLELLDDAVRAALRVGDQVPVAVLRAGGPKGEVLVSINKGQQQADWLRAEKILQSGESLEAEVADFNRGGIVVQFGRLRGFVPNSHISSISRGIGGERLQEAKSELVGKTLWLVVLEVEQRRRRLVLSEREANRHRRQLLLETLTEGEVHTGTVRSLAQYGAFVDLGGIDGLVHISEMDWKHVRRPEDVLSVGDKVEVTILDVDRERERISLSRKRLLPDPWLIVSEDLSEGEIVQGTVTHIASFGAFVDVGEGVEGLVHTSEMPDAETTRASLRPGEPVSVQVLYVDDGRRRISLSMRVAPWPETSFAGQKVVAERADAQEDQAHEDAEHQGRAEGSTEHVQGR
jgi:small subunit ribosomal protein S1